MKKIDTHHHLIEEKSYLENLLREMDRFEIEKTALIGLGRLFKGLFIRGEHDGSCADNDAVENAFKKHPNRFFGLGFVRLGADPPSLATELHERGFTGLKFTIPRKRYDDEEFFPFYEKAQALNLPCLFHTGIINLPVPRPGEGVSSFNMDCIHLEAIAQEFPDLQIIIAHLGVQSFLTALTLVRLFPNIHADLSGSNPGWRANISPEEWRRYLWFPDAHRKLLFGTDVHWSEIATGVELQISILAAAGFDEHKQRDVFHDNAAGLYGFLTAQVV